MFDFEKLDLYQELKQLNIIVYQTVGMLTDVDPSLLEQWKRASLSSVLNLAEGTGRMTPADKRHYYTIARGSIFECVAIIDMINGLDKMDEGLYDTFYAGYEKVSKMLLGLYRSQQ